MGIVERIKEKCAEKSTNINVLEKECELGHGTIRRWTNNSPSVDKLEKVANILRVSLDWLITGKESETLTPDEERLVELYRKADERGKRRILRDAEDEAMEQQSSTSKLDRRA